jgi:hypothetical protein
MGTEEEIVRDSNPNASGPSGAAGDMGVSSERVGPTGPGQVGTDGTRDVTPPDGDEDDAETPPEQSVGNPEDNPEGIRPKAGYSSTDPRSD